MKKSLNKIINNIADLIDLKSIISLLIVLVLCYITINNVKIEENNFLLFSNISTSVITYFFAKHKNDDKQKELTNRKLIKEFNKLPPLLFSQCPIFPFVASILLSRPLQSGSVLSAVSLPDQNMAERNLPYAPPAAPPIDFASLKRLCPP